MVTSSVFQNRKKVFSHSFVRGAQRARLRPGCSAPRERIDTNLSAQPDNAIFIVGNVSDLRLFTGFKHTVRPAKLLINKQHALNQAIADICALPGMACSLSFQRKQTSRQLSSKVHGGLLRDSDSLLPQVNSRLTMLDLKSRASNPRPMKANCVSPA
jgi:hypothetical protein